MVSERIERAIADYRDALFESSQPSHARAALVQAIEAEREAARVDGRLNAVRAFNIARIGP